MDGAYGGVLRRRADAGGRGDAQRARPTRMNVPAPTGEG